MFNWINTFTWKWVYLPFIIGILVAAYYLIGALKLVIQGIIGYFKYGKKGLKEKIKGGFEAISPTRLVKEELKFFWIIQIGFLFGAVFSVIFRIASIWSSTFLVFLGGSGLNLAGLLGKLQQYKALKKQDEIMKKLEEENVR